MSEFPMNLLGEIGVNITELPKDFNATLLYVLEEACPDKRNVRMLLKRYRDGMGIEAIANGFGLTRQRVDVIVKDVKEAIGKAPYCDMLRYGIMMYMENVLMSRVEECVAVGMNSEREKLKREAFEQGYACGKADGENGSSDRSVEAVRTVPVMKYPFSVRAMNIFEKNDIKTLGDILNIGDKLAEIRGFGKTTYTEVVKFLQNNGVNVKDFFPRTWLKFVEVKGNGDE